MATTLAAHVRASGRLSEAEAHFYFTQIAVVLRSRHWRGVAPCGATLDTITLARVVPGMQWPLLQAPEWLQANTGPQVTPEAYAALVAGDAMSADVYAAGRMLHIMLTGGGDQLRPSASTGCLELLDRMLASDPARRPTSQQILACHWMVANRPRLPPPPPSRFVASGQRSAITAITAPTAKLVVPVTASDELWT
jgi:hypothetical protein